MPPASIFVDTNILLRVVHLETAQDQVLLQTLRNFAARGTPLCIAFQNLAEFWNVATRPQKHNGFGRTIAEVAAQADSIAARFKILPENQEAITQWRRLVEEFDISGVMVHDTRLAAIMLAHGIEDMLTLNARDFARFPFIKVINPAGSDLT